MNMQKDEEFLEQYGRLVPYVVNKVFRKDFQTTYANTGLLPEDLIQVGYIGLIKAREKFNPSKGKFSTYAYSYIFGFIMREITQNTHVYAPRTIKETRSGIWKNGIQNNTPSDIAKKLGVCEGWVIDALAYSNDMIRLDNYIHSSDEEFDEPMYNTIKSKVDVEEEAITNLIVDDFLNTLTPNERAVWILKEKQGLTAQKAGEILGESHRAVSRTLNTIRHKASAYGRRMR